MKLVIIERPYDHLDNDEVMHLFVETQAMKINGFKNAYPYGVLPVDASDWYSNHLIGCDDSGSKLKPIVSYKSTEFNVSEQFREEFTLCKLLSNSPEYLKAIRDKIDSNKNFQKIFYDNSLSYNIELAKKMSFDIQVFIKVMHTFYHTKFLNGPHLTFAFGALQFKMERYYHFLGYENLSCNGVELEPVSLYKTFNLPARFFEMKQPSEASIKQAKQYEFIWKNAIVFEAKEKEFDHKKKAA